MKTVQPVFFSQYELIFFPTNIYRIICNFEHRIRRLEEVQKCREMFEN